MAGHLGDVTATNQMLEVARVDAARSLILVRGNVPGAKNGTVVLKPAAKAPRAKGAK
jgi:large subunit ribosomal protein L3